MSAAIDGSAMSPTPDDGDLLTVDQLAERTGMSVRTIRFYASKGLIPAPRLRGRTGLYDAAHRARLELIGELTGLGFTLAAIERQLDFHGGLRWRFEEHVPETRRKIDRIAIFRAKQGLTLREDHTFSDEEYNTYACPWHNNLTAAIVSFRTAKALKRNPGSTFDIRTFRWHNSTPFEWHSRQLLDLGLMEPGQWF